ncbi:MAG: hypothetical protein QW666_01380 [Candidatus Woesearchaeota archaeon]
MTAASKRMILYGFYNENFKKDYPGFDDLDEKEKKALLKDMDDAKAEGYADHELFEVQKDQMMHLDYPTPKNKYFMIYESPHESIEPIYFWSLNHMKIDWSYPIVYKITDIFTASEHSAFWGAATSRLGLASDKVMQFLATIGQFIRKDMFQLIRDIRWIKERLAYHEDARKGLTSAEITLKGIWCDLVDGVVQGQRVSPNIFQLASQLQFTTLPDWFFSRHPQKTDDVDKVVEGIDTTRVIKDLLKRKMHQYLVWREENYKELKQRELFELRYLRQNYNIIRMYLTWLKPYMRHVERLQGDITKLSSDELIASFEGSMIEIEVLGQKIPKGNEKYYSCLLLTFQYRTRPSLQFTQETPGYHRGPVHVGETKISWRAYAWDEKKIKNFIKMKEKEDLEMLQNIDSSIKATMDAIGDDLEKYLAEAEKLEVKEEPKQKQVKQPSLLDPFLAIGKGFGETFGAMVPVFKKEKGPKKPTKADKEKENAEKKTATTTAVKDCWQHYKNFKKAHGMITW